MQPGATIIEIRPFRGGWQGYEGPGVQPYWTGEHAKEDAIGYATARAKFGRGEIRVLDNAGEAVIPTSVKFNHPEFPDIPTTKLEIPARGVYERKAMLSQKNKLMKLGCTTPELLRNLGRNQASS